YRNLERRIMAKPGPRSHWFLTVGFAFLAFSAVRSIKAHPEALALLLPQPKTVTTEPLVLPDVKDETDPWPAFMKTSELLDKFQRQWSSPHVHRLHVTPERLESIMQHLTELHGQVLKWPDLSAEQRAQADLIVLRAHFMASAMNLQSSHDQFLGLSERMLQESKGKSTEVEIASLRVLFIHTNYRTDQNRLKADLDQFLTQYPRSGLEIPLFASLAGELARSRRADDAIVVLQMGIQRLADRPNVGRLVSLKAELESGSIVPLR
ncbi:MAG: hypothetical protein KDA99_30720, partial [Planctomycetales bacterium]|nr:hypothetical protein [Planctomycetales bacterium]